MSGKNLVLPISDLPRDEERERLVKGDEKLFRGSAMTKRGAYAAISYMSCAVLLVMFNKAALSSYQFPCANVITLFQMICSCCFLYALRRGKIITFSAGESLVVSDNSTTLVPFKTVQKTFPIAGAYLLYMLATMESVRGVNVPMYTTLRRTTVVFTMIVEYVLAGQRYSSSVVGSVGLIVVGAFIAGARDLSFDAHGYFIVFLSNITTAIYLATIARIGKSSGLNSFGLMWCNGILCGPILLFWTFIQGDLKRTIEFPYLFSPGFLVLLFHQKNSSFDTILNFILENCAEIVHLCVFYAPIDFYPEYVKTSFSLALSCKNSLAQSACKFTFSAAVGGGKHPCLCFVFVQSAIYLFFFLSFGWELGIEEEWG